MTLIGYFVYLLIFGLGLEMLTSEYGGNSISSLHMLLGILMFILIAVTVVYLFISLILVFSSIVIKKLVKYRRKIFIVALGLIALSFPPYIISSLIQAHNIDKTNTNGNTIVQAIDTYEKTTGVYPSNLTLLTPDYLSDIPKTSKGNDFKYSLLNSTYYRLYYTEYFARYEYDGGTHQWVWHD